MSSDEQAAPGWQTYLVPAGSRVRALAWKPGHEPAEAFRDIPAHGEPDPLRLVPREARRSGKLRVEVEFPPEVSARDDYHVEVCGPRTGLAAIRSDVGQAIQGLELPYGDYAVTLKGLGYMGCANSPPEVEKFVPVTHAVTLASRDQTITLKPQRGCGLRLLAHDPHPRRQLRGSRTAQVSRTERNLVGLFPLTQGLRWTNAYLISEAGEAIALNWRWEELSMAFPRQELKLGRLGESIRPVLPGFYTLVLQGRGIEPLRRTIELSKRWQGLHLYPEVRASVPGRAKNP